MKKKHWYDELVEQGKKDYPDLEDKECWKCGEELVRGSMGYQAGFHFDGCPFSTTEY